MSCRRQVRKALQLPHAATIAEALWLAEVTCMCHRRLEQTSANLWHRMDHADASRLRRELRDASDGILDAAGRAEACDRLALADVRPLLEPGAVCC
jgi:hypothetical protein